MAAWNIKERPAPGPCNEKDTGVFRVPAEMEEQG